MTLQEFREMLDALPKSAETATVVVRYRDTYPDGEVADEATDATAFDVSYHHGEVLVDVG